jgi:hypothetical protein
MDHTELRKEKTQFTTEGKKYDQFDDCCFFCEDVTPTVC